MGRTALVLCALASACATPRGGELFVHGAPLSRADAIVVLGYRPPLTAGGAVEPEMDRRMRRGVELFEEGLAPLLVVVGSAPEARVMSAHARALGVPAAAILADGGSRDTADNARRAVAVLCAGRPECRPTVIVVSSPYHLRRAQRLFRCAGADAQVAATPIPDDALWQASRAAYEYGVRLLYVFDDACARARGSSPRR